ILPGEPICKLLILLITFPDEWARSFGIRFESSLGYVGCSRQPVQFRTARDPGAIRKEPIEGLVDAWPESMLPKNVERVVLAESAPLRTSLPSSASARFMKERTAAIQMRQGPCGVASDFSVPVTVDPQRLEVSSVATVRRNARHYAMK